MESAASIVAVTGELDLSTTAQWDEEVQAAARHAPAVVVDLSQVPFVDSAGVRTIFQWVQRAERRGILVVVVAPHDGPLWRLLDILDLESVAPVCDSREAALEACNGPGRPSPLTSARAA
jgi:stage II sporulation protein AA (anti-sigma F factor antagonist)